MEPGAQLLPQTVVAEFVIPGHNPRAKLGCGSSGPEDAALSMRPNLQLKLLP